MSIALTGECFIGGLNINRVGFSCENNLKFILRTPRALEDRKITGQSLLDEYAGIGAIARGITFSFREPGDQVLVANALVLLVGIPTIEMKVSGNNIFMPFIEGMPLSDYVGQIKTKDDFEIIETALKNLILSHKKGVIIGDRWVKNTIVNSRELTEIDFDIKLKGERPILAAFELSQLLFHLVHFSDGQRPIVTKYLKNFILKNPKLWRGYDKNVLINFLNGHRKYFFEKTELYEGIVPPNQEISQLIQAISDSEANL